MERHSHSQIHLERGSMNRVHHEQEAKKNGVDFQSTPVQRRLVKKSRNKKRRQYNNEEVPSI
ncbi:predicted ORF [Xanthomonas phage XacN1]|nr:predicted ORF [Xanthomonas phage XacN1]